MKRSSLVFLGLFLFSLVIAQTGKDKRGYKGTVTASLKQEIQKVGDKVNKTDHKETTKILFTGRAIVIGNDTYEIVKRSFDGKKTTFTATKRRATFDITYEAGSSISFVDKANTSLMIVYSGLKE